MSIEGRVARILTEFTAALNVGSTLGIEVGDIVVINERVMVDDPVTHEELGEVDVEKLRAEVISVKPKVCVVRVTSSYPRQGGTFLKAITEDPDLEDFKTVCIQPGYFADVSKPADPWGSEPPF